MAWWSWYSVLLYMALDGLVGVAGFIAPTAAEPRQLVSSPDEITAAASLLGPGERAILCFEPSSDRCATLSLHIGVQQNCVLACVHAFELTCGRVVTEEHTLTNIYYSHGFCALAKSR